MLRFAFVLVLSLLMCWCLGDEDRTDVWAKLKGLKQVELEYVGDRQLKELGYDWGEAKPQVELRLRQSSIKITDDVLMLHELPTTGQYDPYTHLRLRILVATSDGVVSYAVELKAYMHWKLPNNPSRAGELELWENGYVGHTTKSRLRSVLNENAELLITSFCNDWLIANPKK